MDMICAHRHRMILWAHSDAITVERFHRSLYSNQNCIWINRNKSKNHRFLSRLIWIQTDTHTQRKYFLHYMPTIRAKTIKNHEIIIAPPCAFTKCVNYLKMWQIKSVYCAVLLHDIQAWIWIVYDCRCLRYLFVIFPYTLLSTNGKYVLNRKWNASFTCLDDEDAWWMCDRIPSVQLKIEFYRKSDK